MVLFDEFPELQGVLHGAEGEQPVDAHAGQRRLGGPGAGGEDQLVVGLCKDLARSQVFHVHRLGVRVDGRHLVADPHVHPEAPPEALRRLERQLRPVGDDAADVVGQAAVGIGYIPGPLKHHDLRRLVQPPEPGRRRGPAGHAAHDHNFHLIVPPFRNHYRCRPDRSRGHRPPEQPGCLPARLAGRSVFSNITGIGPKGKALFPAAGSARTALQFHGAGTIMKPIFLWWPQARLSRPFAGKREPRWTFSGRCSPCRRRCFC